MAMSLHSEETMIVAAYLKEFRLSEEHSTSNESGEKRFDSRKIFHMKDAVTHSKRPRSEGMNGHINVIGNIVCHNLSPFSLIKM